MPKKVDPIEEMRQAFITKFGREPGPNDPLFFDPDADEPRPLDPAQLQSELVAAMRESGVHEAVIHAFKKTGLIVSGENVSMFSPSDLAEYEAAINEYSRGHRRDLH